MNGPDDRCFVDTNILMYAHDSASGPRHSKAKVLIAGLWAAGGGVLSTQVLQELCVNLQRKASRPPGAKATREIIADYLTWHVVANTGDSVLEALDLSRRYRISFWDALIVQAAGVSGAAILYSEDLSDGQFYGSVQVVNPFLEASPR